MGAGANPRLESSMQKLNPHFIYECVLGRSTCSALTVDGVGGVHYTAPERCTNVQHQPAHDKRPFRGSPGAQTSHPHRHQESPSDILASVQHGTRTVGRCTCDANPCVAQRPCTRDSRLDGACRGVPPRSFHRHAALHWCHLDTSVQTGGPRWSVGAMRPTVVHDIIVATATAGPVGFGDLVNQINAHLLKKAIRKCGTILKPASAALRLAWAPATASNGKHQRGARKSGQL